MDNNNEILCFFNFRSPYAYIGIKKALDLNLTLKFRIMFAFFADATFKNSTPKLM